MGGLERSFEWAKLVWPHKPSWRRLGKKRLVNACKVGRQVQITAVTISTVLRGSTVSEIEKTFIFRYLVT